MREVELRVVNKARNVSAKFEPHENDCKTTYDIVLGVPGYVLKTQKKQIPSRSKACVFRRLFRAMTRNLDYIHKSHGTGRIFDRLKILTRHFAHTEPLKFSPCSHAEL